MNRIALPDGSQEGPRTAVMSPDEAHAYGRDAARRQGHPEVPSVHTETIKVGRRDRIGSVECVVAGVRRPGDPLCTEHLRDLPRELDGGPDLVIEPRVDQTNRVCSVFVREREVALLSKLAHR